jgi:hypothetical protein
MYCSRACQRIDWKKQHKKICKHLNVGHGDRQMRFDAHTTQKNKLKEQLESSVRFLDEDGKRFFKLFQESTFEGSQAAAQKMKKIARRQSKNNQAFLLFRSMDFLVRSSNSEMLAWPNSPLLISLLFVDPNILPGDESALQEGGDRVTALQDLANLADPVDYFTHVNQLIVAKQLVERGANVNAVSSPHCIRPLHRACYSENVTNLDFVEYLLEKGADPNAQDNSGKTPLMYTFPCAPGAARFLLNRPTTDANITDRSGASFLAKLRSLINNIEFPNNLDSLQNQFLLQQWREIEEMLVQRGAIDTDAFEL